MAVLPQKPTAAAPDRPLPARQGDGAGVEGDQAPVRVTDTARCRAVRRRQDHRATTNLKGGVAVSSQPKGNGTSTAHGARGWGQITLLSFTLG